MQHEADVSSNELIQVRKHNVHVHVYTCVVNKNYVIECLKEFNVSRESLLKIDYSRGR